MATTKEQAKLADPGAPVYRYSKPGNVGVGMSELPAAWQATNQIFGTLILLTGSSDRLDSEWVLVQSGNAIGFVDLINGTFVPMHSVSLAMPV